MNKKLTSILLLVSLILMAFTSAGAPYASAASTNVPPVPSNNVHTEPLPADPAAKLPSKVQPPQQIIGWTGVARKVVVQAIRYGGTGLGTLLKKIPYSWAKKSGDAIGRWGNKAADVIEEINSTTESGIALALTKVGIPPNDALYIAKFVAFFL